MKKIFLFLSIVFFVIFCGYTEEPVLIIRGYDSPKDILKFYIDDNGIISKINGFYNNNSVDINSERTEIESELSEYQVYQLTSSAKLLKYSFQYNKSNNQAIIKEPYNENITVSAELGNVKITGIDKDYFFATVYFSENSIKRESRENNRLTITEIDLENGNLNEIKEIIDGVIFRITRKYNTFYEVFDPKDSDSTYGQYTVRAEKVTFNPLAYYLNNYIIIETLNLPFDASVYLGGIAE